MFFDVKVPKSVNNKTIVFPYKISYFPQHCLYFLPLPHGEKIPSFWWHFLAFEGV